MTCDFCRYEQEFGLTPLGRGGYDERHLQAKSERAGWHWQEGKHICDECVESLIDEASRE